MGAVVALACLVAGCPGPVHRSGEVDPGTVMQSYYASYDAESDATFVRASFEMLLARTVRVAPQEATAAGGRLVGVTTSPILPLSVGP